MFAAQVGGHVRINDKFSLGARSTYFRFGNVNLGQLRRGASGVESITSNGGNILDGMTGGNSMNVIEGGFRHNRNIQPAVPECPTCG